MPLFISKRGVTTTEFHVKKRPVALSMRWRELINTRAVLPRASCPARVLVFKVKMHAIKDGSGGTLFSEVKTHAITGTDGIWIAPDLSSLTEDEQDVREYIESRGGWVFVRASPRSSRESTRSTRGSTLSTWSTDSYFDLCATSSVVPYCPGTYLESARRGILKRFDVIYANYNRFYFKKMFHALRFPFQNEAGMHDLNHLLTLFSFLTVNLLPVHMFSLIIFSDYAVLSEMMPLGVRIFWLNCLFYITWFFVCLYAVNVGRLVATLAIDLGQHMWWIDWEEALYRFVRPRVIQKLKSAADNLWESYHQRCWGYIRGIQAEVEEKKLVIHEISEARNLPPRVQGLITDFVCPKGTEELDYRWYLHDNRANSQALDGLDYACREMICSYLIPKPAFEMSKDDIVNLYCA